jgi:hypothetical protein
MPGYVQPKRDYRAKSTLTMPSVVTVVMDVAWMHGAPFAERPSVDERLAYLKPERLLQ